MGSRKGTLAVSIFLFSGGCFCVLGGGSYQNEDDYVNRSVRAEYSVPSSLWDVGLPREGIEENGILDRFDGFRSNYREPYLRFPYDAMHPHARGLFQFVDAGASVLDQELSGIEALYEVRAVDDPSGDYIEYVSLVPSGFSSPQFSFIIRSLLYHNGLTYSEFQNGDRIEITGLETSDMGNLRWILCDDDGQWWVSEAKVDPLNSALVFSEGSDGMWAPIFNFNSRPYEFDLEFEEKNFKNVQEVGFTNLGVPFAENRDSFLRFRNFFFTSTSVDATAIRLRADLKYGVGPEAVLDDDQYYSNLYPDALIYRGTKFRFSRKKRRRQFSFSVQNDGNLGCSQHVMGIFGGKRRYRAVARDKHGENVTANLASGITTEILEIEESADFSVVVSRRGRRSLKGVLILKSRSLLEGISLPKYHYIPRLYQLNHIPEDRLHFQFLGKRIRKRR